jgi:hypothetical protein
MAESHCPICFGELEIREVTALIVAADCSISGHRHFSDNPVMRPLTFVVL